MVNVSGLNAKVIPKKRDIKVSSSTGDHEDDPVGLIPRASDSSLEPKFKDVMIKSG